jgi:hypothetical protein
VIIVLPHLVPGRCSPTILLLAVLGRGRQPKTHKQITINMLITLDFAIPVVVTMLTMSMHTVGVNTIVQDDSNVPGSPRLGHSCKS